MISRQAMERSPLRALEQALDGGFSSQGLGVVLSPSGVGKTACLVQIGIDALLSGKTVLHVSNESPVGHLRTYYDELFRCTVQTIGLDNGPSVLLDMERRRLLICQPGPTLRLDKLKESISVALGALGREPDMLIVEGFDLETANELHVQQLRDLAWSLGAQLWLSVRTHRDDPTTHPRGYPAPVDRFESLIDVMLMLASTDGQIHLHVLKNRDAGIDHLVPLHFDAVTMQLVIDTPQLDGVTPPNASQFVLHTGGAKGAECLFGEQAERYGVGEITFSFEGHDSRVRSRGLRLLSDEDLNLGDVSLRYVSHHLGRVFPSPPAVRKVIQSIWHQIRPCQQVFVVGQIQQDGTVRGGTGWGAELARRWNKQLYVFDQMQNQWYYWDSQAWIPAEPVITSHLFAGTGTANVTPEGRRAIEELFKRSFG